MPRYLSARAYFAFALLVHRLHFWFHPHIPFGIAPKHEFCSSSSLTLCQSPSREQIRYADAQFQGMLKVTSSTPVAIVPLLFKTTTGQFATLPVFATSSLLGPA